MIVGSNGWRGAWGAYTTGPFTREDVHGAWTVGYGFELIVRGGEVMCLYKDGYNEGVDGITAWFPAAGLTVHMLANCNGPLWKMFRAVKEIVIGG